MVKKMMVTTIKHAKEYLLNKYKKLEIITEESSNSYFYLNGKKVILPISKEELCRIYKKGKRK